MTAIDNGPIGPAGGTLSTSSGDATRTRLGVTRLVGGSDGQITATWDWSATLPATRDVTLRTSLARSDGTGVRRYHYTVPDGAIQSATFSLPADALKDLGDSWTWTQTVIVTGR